MSWSDQGKQGQQCCDARVRTSRIDAHIYTLVAPHRVEQAYQNTPSHTRHHHGPGCALPGCHSHGVTMCGVHSSCTCRENVTSKKSRQQHNLGPTRCVLAFCFSVRFFIAQHARKQFRAIPFHHQDSSRSFTNPRAILSPPGLGPLFHQLSGHSFTTRTRAALTPQRLPFFHRQDSTHAVCARPSWMRLWAPSSQSLGLVQSASPKISDAELRAAPGR